MRRKRKKRNRKRRLLTLAVIALLMIGLFGGIGWMILGRRTETAAEKSDLVVSPKTTEIMVMGVDPRTDDTGRSDTLLLVSLDTQAKKAAVFSVPRDTRVEMEKDAYEKINHAYAYGGHEYTQTLLEKLLATKLDGYVLINIRAFERIIDAVGGVDLDVEKRMYYEDPWDEDGGLVIDLLPGEQHLDGQHAMQYVRFRDEEGDIGRVARQQKFMQAFLARVTSPEVIPHLGQIVRELTSVIETDLEVGDLIRYVALLPDVKGNGMVSHVLPGKPAWWQETSYWLPDIRNARKLLAEQMGVVFTPEMDARAQRDAELYAESLPKDLTDVNGTMRIAANAEALSETAEKKTEGKPKKDALRPENIRVRVLNCSGIKGAAARSADVLRERGFSIDNEDVGNGSTNDKEETILTVPKGAEKFFKDLPFPCAVHTGEGDEAVLEIGKDYKNE